MSIKHISPGTYLVQVQPSHEWLFESIWKAYYPSFYTNGTPQPLTNTNHRDDLVKAMMMMDIADPKHAAFATGENPPLVIPSFWPRPQLDRAPYPFLTPPPIAQQAGQGGPFGPLFGSGYQGNDYPAFQPHPGCFPDSTHAGFTQSPPVSPSDGPSSQ
ncbi:hypothetical protein PG993_001225 [Apiospora rasikravindrae]|uniref:Uncharacterized protein n=1 Tax=Apiospora rasikravindrae TaxID=990691 RepID=A0ABR1UDH5_9PEZI